MPLKAPLSRGAYCGGRTGTTAYRSHHDKENCGSVLFQGLGHHCMLAPQQYCSVERIYHCTRLIRTSPTKKRVRRNKRLEDANVIQPQVLLWALVLTGCLHTQSTCRDVRARISGYGAIAVLFSFLSESMPIFSAMSLQNHGLAYSSTDFAIPAGAGGVWLMISATCIYPRVCKALGNKRYAPHLTQTLL